MQARTRILALVWLGLAFAGGVVGLWMGYDSMGNPNIGPGMVGGPGVRVFRLHPERALARELDAQCDCHRNLPLPHRRTFGAERDARQGAQPGYAIGAADRAGTAGPQRLQCLAAAARSAGELGPARRR